MRDPISELRMSVRAQQNAFPFFVALLLSAVAVTPVSASIARAIPFDQKVTDADAIVEARCLHTESRFDDSQRWILTYSTFAVEKTLKGGGAGEVTIVTPGGSANGLHQETVGVPTFREGDHNVLFVKATRAGASVLYFDQGAYQVFTEGGEPHVRPVHSGLVLVDTQAGRAVEGENERSLEQFENEISASLRAPRNRDVSGFAVVQARPLKPRTALEAAHAFLQTNRLIITFTLAGILLALLPLVRRR
jgi:hypothetical protein